MILKKKYYILIFLCLLPAVVRLFVGEWAYIPTASMYPTLLSRDWIWYEKYTYGAVVPCRWSEIPLLNLACLIPSVWASDQTRDWGYRRCKAFRQPERMDVIIFRHPANRDLLLVKRVIGLPGDTLCIMGGIVYINGVRTEEKGKRCFSYKEADIDFPKDKKGAWTTLNYGPLIIPKNDSDESLNGCFVMGDARGNSVDSRFIGLVPFRNVVGKAVCVLYSPEKMGEGQKCFFRKIE